MVAVCITQCNVLRRLGAGEERTQVMAEESRESDRNWYLWYQPCCYPNLYPTQWSLLKWATNAIQPWCHYGTNWQLESPLSIVKNNLHRPIYLLKESDITHIKIVFKLQIHYHLINFANYNLLSFRISPSSSRSHGYIWTNKSSLQGL